MKAITKALLAAWILLLATSVLMASGLVGIYCIVEKVAFEPNDQAPERVKVWGVFSFAAPNFQSPPDQRADPREPPVRGFVYFKAPSGTTRDAALKEWRDLKAVAGTGQAVAFGNWFYGYNGFVEGQPQINAYVLPDSVPNHPDALRAHKDSETNVEPVTYSTNAGIVKLGGNYAALIAQLKEALKQ